MDLSLATLLQLARFTVQRPRDGARAVMRLDLPPQARWAALALMAVASALLTALSMGLLPADMRARAAEGFPSPLASAALQLGVLIVAVHAIHRIGRWRGGRGSLGDAVVVVAWLQFILLLLQVVQVVAQLLLPPVSDALGIVGIVLFYWLLTNFVAEVHGFPSLIKVFAGIVLATVVLAFALAIFLLPFMGGLVVGI
jgi:hypothetical protein